MGVVGGDGNVNSFRIGEAGGVFKDGGKGQELIAEGFIFENERALRREAQFAGEFLGRVFGEPGTITEAAVFGSGVEALACFDSRDGGGDKVSARGAGFIGLIEEQITRGIAVYSRIRLKMGGAGGGD